MIGRGNRAPTEKQTWAALTSSFVREKQCAAIKMARFSGVYK